MTTIFILIISVIDDLTTRAHRRILSTGECGHEVRLNAVLTAERLCRAVDFFDHTSLLIHPLMRLLTKDRRCVSLSVCISIYLFMCMTDSMCLKQQPPNRRHQTPNITTVCIRTYIVPACQSMHAHLQYA